MRQDKDRTTKWLLAHHSDSILWLAGIHGFESCRPVAAEVVAPRRLPDGLLEVRYPGEPEPDLVLVEIEAYPGNDVDPQVFEDILAIELVRRVTPEVVCLVLKPKGNLAVTGTRTRTSRRGLTTVSAAWRVVNLWTLDAESLLAADDPGLIPWVPLAATTRPADEVLADCGDRLERVPDANDRSGLQVVTAILASFALNRPGLKNLFRGGKKMLEALIESPVLDEFLEVIKERAAKGIHTQREANLLADLEKIEAEAQAEYQAKFAALVRERLAQPGLESQIQSELVGERLAALRESILVALDARFGSVPDAVRAGLAGITDPGRLEALVRSAATCPDLPAFAAGL